MIKIKLLIIPVLLIFACRLSLSEFYIGEVYIDQRDVFDSTQDDWFFAAPMFNAVHINTKKYLIEDELLFAPGDLLDITYIEETERNLRNTGYFTDVRIILDSVTYDTYDVYIITSERWSTQPSILFGTGGGEARIGGRFAELNLLGHGINITGEALHRSENDIGWQGYLGYFQRRFLRSEFSLDIALTANKFRTDQLLSINKPFRTLETEYSFGANYKNSFGKDFLYIIGDTTRLIPLHENKINGYISKAWLYEDRVFATIFMEYDKSDRGDEIFRRAYDNSGKFLVQFSSISEEFVPIQNINTYVTEDMIVGGYGSATLGRIFPVNPGGESLYYVAGQGERSYYDGSLYLWGQLTAASAFSGSNARYSYQGFQGLGFYQFNKHFLLAARIKQQTIWNWSAIRQLVLDNDAGLRGYELNRIAGDNRIVSNFEIRAFPDFKLWVLNLSGVAFYDAGLVWSQDTKIRKSQVHNSFGMGLRFHNTKSRGPTSVFRLDFAYNFDDGKLGGIIFATEQLFSAFGNHNFKIPELYGTEFDYE